LGKENDQSRDELSQDDIRALLETMKRGYSSDPEIRALALEKAARHLRELEATGVWRVEKLPQRSTNHPAADGDISDEGFGSGPVIEDGWIHRRR
jgi:hypothetical protein